MMMNVSALQAEKHVLNEIQLRLLSRAIKVDAGSVAFDWSIFMQVLLELNVKTSYKNHITSSLQRKNLAAMVMLAIKSTLDEASSIHACVKLHI